MNERLLLQPYYLSHRTRSIARAAITAFMLFISVVPFPSAQEAGRTASGSILRLYVDNGPFSEALAITRRISRAADVEPRGDALDALKRGRGVLTVSEYEFLVRTLLESLLVDAESGRYPADGVVDSDTLRASLGDYLRSVDSWRDPQLRRVLYDIGAYTGSGDEWRTALQRGGVSLEAALRAEGGRPDGDVFSETLAWLRAVGELGDRALLRNVERIREIARVRAVVLQARAVERRLTTPDE